MNGQPKPAFYMAVGGVVLALIAFAVYRSDIFAPAPKPPAGDGGKIDPAQLGGGAPSIESNAEHPDAQPQLMAKEYTFRPRQERLPDPAGVGAYAPLDKNDNTVRFALNVWAGWGPIILANNGFQPGHVWKTPDGKQEFKVELVVIDDPVQMRDAYSTGNVHIGWGTLDMLPLFMEGFVDKSGKPRDARVMPRVFQQIDWSNGGDGIVVRENIKTVADLRGKKLVLAQNSPSHYFALNMLVSGGVQPSEVEFQFTADAFQAAAAFNAQKDIAGAVSWAPDIYNLEKVKGNRMLVTTLQANKLISDIWFTRADFARDEPGIVEALVRGIFDAMTDLKQEAKKKELAELMAKGYNIPATDALAMQGDAHNTNWAENAQFFLNQQNPTNFERVWNQSYYLYKRIRSITNAAVPFDQVMDPSVIQKLGQEEKYSSQQDEYKIQFNPRTVGEIRDAETEILTNTVVVKFFPNSADLRKTIVRKVDGKDVEELYDPSVDLMLEEVAKLAGQFGAAQIIIEGHTDASMKGQVPASLVKELSLHRASAIKEALLQKFKDLDPNRFAVEGMGWEHPADPADPDNHYKNRRVEIKVFSAEKQ
ncbi:MAG: phosphate ABC transporter substrate-binding/OmpA family protein [Planctomycetales bacterium]